MVGAGPLSCLVEKMNEPAIEWLENEFEVMWRRHGHVRTVKMYGEKVEWFGVRKPLGGMFRPTIMEIKTQNGTFGERENAPTTR